MRTRPALGTGDGVRSLGLVRRLGWGVADQAISSMSNFALGIIVARSLAPAPFGAFTLAFVTFGFLLSASRGTSTDPLMVRFSGVHRSAWAKAVAGATATSLLTGVAFGLVCVAVGLLLPAEVGRGFVALGVGLPGILLQDSYRFAFFSCGRGEHAFLNDLLWGVLQLVALVGLLWTGDLTAVTALLAFGGTATLAAGVGILQSGVRPRLGLVRAWLLDHKDLGTRYLLENVSIGGARQLRMTLVGIVVGLAAVGQIRAAEILMGPFLVLLSGVSQVAVPEAKQVLSRAPTRLTPFCLLLSSAQAGAAGLWGVVAFAVFPLGLGAMLLDGNWGPAQALLLPVLANILIRCFEIGAAAGVRALGASRRSLAAQLVNAGLYVVGGGVGAALAGAAGSCWGVAAAGFLGSCVWWYHLRKGLEEHLVQTELHPVS